MSRAFLSASSEYLDVDTAVLTAAPITMACWFNVNDVTARYTLFSLVNTASGQNFFALKVAGDNANDPFFAECRSSAGWSAGVINGVTANVWHHGCGVFNSATSRYAYLNGSASSESTTDRTPSSIGRTCIGGLIHVSPTEYTDGAVAEAAIWNVALTAAEIASLSDGVSPLFIRPQNLLFYAPLIRDDDEDIVGGLSLTAGGTPTVDPHPRIIRPSTQILSFPTAVAAGGTTLHQTTNYQGMNRMNGAMRS